MANKNEYPNWNIVAPEWGLAFNILGHPSRTSQYTSPKIYPETQNGQIKMVSRSKDLGSSAIFGKPEYLIRFISDESSQCRISSLIHFVEACVTGCVTTGLSVAESTNKWSIHPKCLNPGQDLKGWEMLNCFFPTSLGASLQALENREIQALHQPVARPAFWHLLYTWQQNEKYNISIYIYPPPINENSALRPAQMSQETQILGQVPCQFKTQSLGHCLEQCVYK